MTAITPLQALRRLVDVARLIDADECPELYNQIQAELAVAGAVLAEPIKHADDFAHFLSYSGLSGEPADVLEKMRRAFEAARPAETQQPVAWRVTGNFTDLPFKNESSADAYMSGLLANDSNGGYKKLPLFAAPLPESGSAAQDARDAANLPEKMAPEMREAMWDAITRHGSSNLEYWIEDLYNDIRIAAMALEKK